MHKTSIAIHVPAPVTTDPSQLTVHAFGDEGAFGKVIAYGLVVIPAPRLPVAEQFLPALKRRYRVDPQEEFHCLDVFHWDKKQESGWKHLSEAQVLEFAEELLLGMASFSAGFIVGGVHRSEYPTELSAEGNFPAGEMGTKQLAGMTCMAALLRLSEVYDDHQIRFRPDPDSSKMSFFGRTMRADRNYQLTRSDTKQQIVPETLDHTDKPALLQVADLLAFTATHALSDEKVRNKEGFKHLYRICNPKHSFMVYKLPPQPSILESRHAEIMKGN
jgi:hypothetical protein